MSDKLKDLSLEPIDIDLNKLFSLSFDNLKSFMASLLENQTIMTNKINELNKKIKYETDQNKKFHAYLVNIDRKQKTTANSINKLKNDFKSISNKTINKEKQKIERYKSLSSKNNNNISNEQEKKLLEEDSLNENDIENYDKEFFANENEIQLLKEKIENLEKTIGIQNIKKTENKPFLEDFPEGENDMEIMKLEIKNIKIFDEEINTKTTEIKKTVEDISVKALDNNIYDLLKECKLTDGTVDAAKLLVLSSEKKLNKKMGFNEEKIKKNEEEISKLKIECQNIKDLSQIIDRNLKDFKLNVKDVNTQIQKSNEENTNKINKIGKKLKEDYKIILQKIEEEKNNNKKTFDRLKIELKNIKNKDSNKETINSNESGLSEKDHKIIKDLNKKIIDAEKQIKILGSLIDNTKIKEEISRIERDLSTKADKLVFDFIKEKLTSHNTDINNLTEAIDQTGDLANKNLKDINLFLGKLESLTASVTTLKMAIETISGMKTEQVIDTSQFLNNNIFQQFIINYKKENEKFEKNFENIRKQIKNVSEKIKTKANNENFKNFEKLFNNNLEELKLFCNKKFAEKFEMSKFIKYLDAQIKYLLDLYIKRIEKNDSWLLAKKPIGGFSCAACENYLGDLKDDGDYVAWNKYPKKEKQNKNYRVGNGFSRMLNMLNLDIKNTVDGLKEKNYESDDDNKNYISSNRHAKTLSNNIISLNKRTLQNFNKSNMLPNLTRNENVVKTFDQNSADVINESKKMASTCTNKYRDENKKYLSPDISKINKKNK